MFHRTKDNRYVNLDYVLHVTVEKEAADERFHVTFHLTTGATVSDRVFNPYLRPPGTMIAAEPGYFVLDTVPVEEAGFPWKRAG